jgi:hypothetical protein
MKSGERRNQDILIERYTQKSFRLWSNFCHLSLELGHLTPETSLLVETQASPIVWQQTVAKPSFWLRNFNGISVTPRQRIFNQIAGSARRKFRWLSRSRPSWPGKTVRLSGLSTIGLFIFRRQDCFEIAQSQSCLIISLFATFGKYSSDPLWLKKLQMVDQPFPSQWDIFLFLDV